MLAITDILQTIEENLKKIWPEDVVYQNAQPTDFVRPSFFIQVTKTRVKMLNSSEIAITLDVVIKGFVAIDEQQQTHYAQLVARMAQVLSLFYDGYIHVGDRNPHVVKLKSWYQPDFFTVKVRLNWGEEQMVGDALPLMGELKLNMQEG